MSKKKSYMNYKNVLLENKFMNMLKNLFSFDKKMSSMLKRRLSSKEKKALKNPVILKHLVDFEKAYKKSQDHAKKARAELDKQGFM